MSSSYIVATILLMAVVMFSLRAVPFLLPQRLLDTPKVRYVGKYLPAVIMLLLVIYAQKDAAMASLSVAGISAVAIAVVALMHLWKENMMLSILSGTGIYMLLMHIFV